MLCRGLPERPANENTDGLRCRAHGSVNLARTVANISPSRKATVVINRFFGVGEFMLPRIPRVASLPKERKQGRNKVCLGREQTNRPQLGIANPSSKSSCEPLISRASLTAVLSKAPYGGPRGKSAV